MPSMSPPSLEELHSITTGPGYVKARIAWTGDLNDTAHEDDTVDEDDKNSTINQTMPNDVKRVLSTHNAT